jgi:hypothetical protein
MGTSESIHAFSSKAELARGGFDVLHLQLDEQWSCGWAVLKKSLTR